jgi:hypothetical protein
MKFNEKERYCYSGCKYLSITELEQRKVGSKNNPHICRRYGKRVKHFNLLPVQTELFDLRTEEHNPLLIRLEECDYFIGEENEN